MNLVCFTLLLFPPAGVLPTLSKSSSPLEAFFIGHAKGVLSAARLARCATLEHECASEGLGGRLTLLSWCKWRRDSYSCLFLYGSL